MNTSAHGGSNSVLNILGIGFSKPNIILEKKIPLVLLLANLVCKNDTKILKND